MQQFRQKTELMRNMMGLLGNVAEVKELRPRLMPYIKTFYDLVDSLADGIEVSVEYDEDKNLMQGVSYQYELLHNTLRLLT